MKTKQQLWAELTAANGALSAFTPGADNTNPRSLSLERELAINASFFAQHVKRALDHIGVAPGTQWLGRLLAGDDGAIGEAYAFGSFADRGFHFTPFNTVPSANLFRTTVDTTDLDGRFELVSIHFDIKSLSCPSEILGALTDRVNSQIGPSNLVARPSGNLDFDHKELEGAEFATAANAISAAAPNKAPYVHSGLGVTYRFHDASAPLVFSEGVFNPYRFAQENRHIVVTNAKQVHRTERFVFVYVYSELDHELALFPELAPIGERALARRVFMELTRANDLASRYCKKVDPAATVQQIARAIGALLFVCVRQRSSESELRCYLNPNANPAQQVTYGHIEQLTDFDLNQLDALEDFVFDNY